MHSPPVQPISSSRSGTGSVTSMWVEVTASRLRSGPNPAAAALIATTAVGAITRPPVSVSTTTSPDPPARRRRARVPSWIATPSSSNAARRPSASLAGCTLAACRINAPPPNRGDAQRERTSAAVSGTSSAAAPSRSQAAVAGEPASLLGGAGRDLEVAGLAKPDVDPTLLRPGADLVDGAGGVLADRQRGAVAEGGGEIVEPVPERVEEARVAAARAGAAGARLEHRDPSIGRAPAKRPRGPQPGVATADDHHVGAVVAPEAGGGGDRARLTGPVARVGAHPSAPLGAPSAADASSARCRVAMVAGSRSERPVSSSIRPSR